MNFPTIRQTAKEALKGKWGIAIMASVIVSLVMNGPSMILQSVMSLGPAWIIMASYLSILTLFLMPIQVGLVRVFMDFVEDKDANLDRVFYGFKNKLYGRNLGAQIMMAIYIVLWAFLLIVPAIIKAMSYAMTTYILADPKYNRVSSIPVITISRRLMDGHKLRLFGFQLYYTWWYVIVMAATNLMFAFEFEPEIAYTIWGLSLVIYTFYTTPLLQAVTTTFYKSISQPPNPPKEYKETPLDTPILPPQPNRYDPLAWDYDDDSIDTSEDDSPPDEESEDVDDEDDDPFFY